MSNNSRKVLEYFEDDNTNLRNYFRRVRNGNSEIYRTNFYKGKSTDLVLQDWSKRLNRVGSAWPTLLSFEKDLAKKVGPMSVMKPLDKRLPDIDSYYTEVSSVSLPISESALSCCLTEWDELSGHQLTVVGQRDTVEHMRLSTNSGSPFFTRRSTVVKDSYPVSAFIDGDEVVVKYPWGTKKACAILGWRGQEGGPSPEDVKQRVVWMFPFSVNILELQVYQSLIMGFQKHNYVPAWNGNESVDAEVTNLFDTKDPDDLVVCTDFTAFDQHFNPSLQDASYALIDSLFNNGVQDWLTNIYRIKYMIPLMYDYGKLKWGEHGMGSGSGGTNCDETLAHRALQYEAALEIGSSLNTSSMCLGDDGILSYPGISIDQVVKSYSSHGLEMNTSKQYASTSDCVYLRRWHHRDYRPNGKCAGVYSTNRALGRLMMQERFYDNWSPQMVALRQLSILENCKYHPLREEFAEFCMKGDKYRLGIDLPGFLTNIQSEAEKATSVMPDFLGYTRSLDESEMNLNNWWIVQYLKSLK